jgi:hypothetical protein
MIQMALAQVCAARGRQAMGQLGEYFSILSVDQRRALVMALVMALGGIALAAVGVWGVAMPESGLARWNRSYLARDLRAWGTDGASGNPAEIDALTRRLWQSYGWSLVGGGLGAIMGAGVTAGLALSAAGFLAGVMGDGPSLLETVVFQCFTLGLALGYLLGTLTVTRVATSLAWADLRRRRVSDYRTAWLGWGPFALAGASILLLIASLFSQSPTQSAVAREFRASHTFLAPPTIPSLAAMAVWALLIPVLGALLCHWIATSRRALTSTDPQIARAADEVRRAISIGQVVSYTWVTGGWTLASVTLVALAPAPGMSGVLQWLLGMLGILAFAFGGGLNGLRGRLGGRVTGWPSLRSLSTEMTQL